MELNDPLAQLVWHLAGDPAKLADGRVTVLPRFDDADLLARMRGHLWVLRLPAERPVG